MVRTTLIEKYGSWENVCKHYTELLGMNDKFFNWMMLSKDFSPSGYKEGMFFDPKMYKHCYLIYKKINNQREGQHHVSVWTGKTGKGKSTGGSQMASLVSPVQFSMTYMCYTPSQFFRLVPNCKRGDTIQIDEGDRFFGSKNTMTKLGRQMTEAFGILRGLGIHVIICFSKYHKLDNTIREELVDTIVLKLVNSKGKTKNDKYRHYKAFNSTASQIINDGIRKGLVLPQIKVPASMCWMGHNSPEFPTINDVNETIYKQNKLKYVRDRFKEWADEYQDEYDKQSDEIADEIEDKQEYVSITQAKEIVPLSKGTFLNKINTKELDAIKIGSKFLIKKSSLRDMLQKRTK